jgi:carbon storage regulator
MLVIPRNLNESIIIGDYITVVVLAIHGDTLRLGIEGPKGTSVQRTESPELRRFLHAEASSPRAESP